MRYRILTINNFYNFQEVYTFLESDFFQKFKRFFSRDRLLRCEKICGVLSAMTFPKLEEE